MTKKEWQRHMAYEALVILGMLALLLFVCRLWPILLLVILGIFAAARGWCFSVRPRCGPSNRTSRKLLPTMCLSRP